LSDDLSEFALMNSNHFYADTANAVLAHLGSRAKAYAERVGASSACEIRFSVEARYAQQIWEIKLPLRTSRFESEDAVATMIEDFHRLHHDIFAFDDRAAEIEFVNWRARVSCDLGEGVVGRIATPEQSITSEQKHRRGWFHGGYRDVPVLNFSHLDSDRPRRGPAIVETPFTTIVVDANAAFQLDPSGGLSVELDLSAEDPA
jgi:N-methylhydantoinase A